jgi:hypothetical protein
MKNLLEVEGKGMEGTDLVSTMVFRLASPERVAS